MLANSVDPDEMRFDFYFWHAKREKFVEIVTQQSKLSWRGGGDIYKIKGERKGYGL